MPRFGVAPEDAVGDLALRRLLGVPVNRKFLLGLEGVGGAGNLDELRGGRRADLG